MISAPVVCIPFVILVFAGSRTHAHAHATNPCTRAYDSIFACRSHSFRHRWCATDTLPSARLCSYVQQCAQGVTKGRNVGGSRNGTVWPPWSCCDPLYQNFSACVPVLLPQFYNLFAPAPTPPFVISLLLCHHRSSYPPLPCSH
jgi:hypothetical protein